jgi:hypothetical protein
MKLKPPPETYVLVALMILMGVAGLFEGISLIADPSGQFLRLDVKSCVLMYSIHDFLFAGLVLIVMFGVMPLLLVYPLIFKPRLKWANSLNIYPKRHWAWTYTLLLGILLILCVDAQIIIIGYQSIIQIVHSIYGVFIVFICLLPEQINYFSKWKLSTNFQKFADDNEYK